MKRILFFGFAFLLLAPFSAFAQTPAPYARYCPDPTTDFFKGSIYHTDDGEPWIEVVVDPKFEQEELRGKRKITGDIPLTPVYDLVVRIKPEFNYYCIPGWVEGVPVTAEKLPFSLPIEGAITLVSGSNANAFVLLKGINFLRTGDKDEQGRFLYEGKLQGWPQGIVMGEKLELLIQAIREHIPIFISLGISQSDGHIEKKASQISSFDLCTPIWGNSSRGNDTHKIIAMRGRNSVQASFFAMTLDAFRKIVTITDPFSGYQDYFQYFVDLATHDDSAWRTVVLDKDGNKKFERGVGIAVSSKSSCDGWIHDTHIFYSGIIARAYALPSIGLTFVSAKESDEVVVLHEFGHAFADLRDEYPYLGGGDVYPTLTTPAFVVKMMNAIAGKNCSFNPASDFTYGTHLYGATTKLGCGFKEVGLGASKKALFRPSEKSIMKIHYETELFNVVSCGWIIAAIKGGDAKSYFPECAKMDGVIKDGVVAQNVFESVLAKVQSLLPPRSLPLATTTPPRGLGTPPQPLRLEDSALPLRKGGEGGEETSLFAAVGGAQFAAGQKVKVIVPESRTPPAEFVPLGAAEAKQIKSPDACLDATGQSAFKNKQQPFRADIERSWKNEAECAQGVASATVLEQKIEDAETSIAHIQNFIASLALSAEETKNLTTLDGASFSIIPAGERQEKVYRQVGTVSMQCVSGGTVSLGTGGTSKGNIYAATSEALQRHAAAIRDNVSEKRQEYQKEPAENRGTVTHATLGRLTDLQETLESNFILITANALSRYHRGATAESAIPLSVSLTRGANGQASKCEKFARFVPSKLALGGVKGDFLMSTITFGGNVFTDDCIPEEYLLKELKAGVGKNLAYFEKQKAEYEARIASLQSQLTGIKNEKYYCAAPALSVTTPHQGNAASSATGRRDEGSGATLQSSEPSYLIIESFDPNNPWGEIVEIVSEKTAGEEITRSDLVEEMLNLVATKPTITAPRAGEVFNAGALMTVRWSRGSLPQDAAMRMSLWRGRTITTALHNELIQGITTPNDENEPWVIPPTLRPGFYFIEIACVDKNIQCVSGASPAFRVVGVELDSSGMAVNLTVDGSDKPPPLKRGSKLTLSWEVSDVGSCYPNFPTPGIGAIRGNGKIELVFDSAVPKIYELVCYNAEANGTKSDSIVVTPLR